MVVAAVSPARKAAFQILLAVERGEAHSDELLRGAPVNTLSGVDRNLATALVLGVLRWQLPLDEQIRKHLNKPNAKLDAEVRVTLRMGAFQLLHLDRIPAHAAIDESVELTKQAGQRFAARMVNAVLRKLPRGEAAAERGEVQAFPDWMIDRWEREYGREVMCAICARGQRQARLSLRMVDADAEQELASAGVEFSRGELLTAARVIVAGDVTATAAFREGRVRIQDEGSQLVGEIAAAAAGMVEAATGESLDLSHPSSKVRSKDGARDIVAGARIRVLDACAAPGGKTLILAERLPQARIVACDASAARLEQMRERLSCYGERIELRVADAAVLSEDAAFDLVLADVPCSGTGTLGRNPEIRHRLHVEDLARQAERQRAILRAALRAVRPGGRVVYSTCSLEPEENEQVVAAVLAEGGVRRIPVAECIETMRSGGVLMPEGAERLARWVTAESALRLLPGAFETDGFFVAMMERV